MPIGAVIKRILPHTLLGRSILIIVVPLILLQLVSAWVFYDRHWETIARRLASAVAVEINLMIETLHQFPGPENESWILGSTTDLGFRIVYRRGDILPNQAPVRDRSTLERLLTNALEESVRRPFHLDARSLERDVGIKVQLSDGVLDLRVPRERLFSSTTYIFVMWMVGTSLVLFAVATLFMRNQVRSIRRLAIAVDAFGKGRETPPIKPEGATEVRRVAHAFNIMRERIQRMITQRTEMLAGVSHDLRTPLTRMKLQLAMLPASKELAELQSDVAEMEKMLAAYLAFARGEAAESVVDTDLGALLDDIAQGARRAGATVAAKSTGDLVVAIRPDAFKRCLGNIVANAAFHGSHVEISAARRGDTIEIVVDDDGPGIPEEKREEVFRPFYRLEGSRNPETGGTGLGLAIARDLIRGHGGDITLDRAPMGGLRARLKLPL